MRKLRLLALLLFMQACMFPILALQLCKNGIACYDIVISRQASLSEKTAATELSRYLEQLTKTKFKVVESTTNNSSEANTNVAGSKTKSPVEAHIFVGYDSTKPIFQDFTPYAEQDESFEYRTQGNDIMIFGGRQRGTMYGVFSFLEEKLGIHWYTPSYTFIPQAADGNLAVPGDFAVRQHPSLAYRFDYGYDTTRDDVWCAHNLLNMQEKSASNDYGGLTSYWGAHTFQKLLPPNEYFATHPEYFSLVKGKRIENGQLCLSNPEVLRLVTERLSRYIKANPNCWGYDVSQNDNKLYCQCKKCNAIAKQYGGQSGLMLWFVNQVAQVIGKSHPEKLIGTFAYEYTRRPPKGIRPASNVVIRLCDIECCFLHPIDGCSENKDFLNDLWEWKKLSPRIFVWDYNVNFHYYHLPFPNHHVVAHNLQLFQENGVMGVLELGAYDAKWSDFSEMRQWVNAKLLWNPALSTDSLAQMFIQDYYGKAADKIWQYYQAICQLPTSRTHTDCHADPKEALYTSNFRKQSIALLEQAEQTAKEDRKNKDILPRVRRVLAQALYTRTLLDGAASLTDGTYLRLKRIIDDDNTTMRERGQTINQYLSHHGYI